MNVDVQRNCKIKIVNEKQEIYLERPHDAFLPQSLVGPVGLTLSSVGGVGGVGAPDPMSLEGLGVKLELFQNQDIFYPPLLGNRPRG